MAQVGRQIRGLLVLYMWHSLPGSMRNVLSDPDMTSQAKGIVQLHTFTTKVDHKSALKSLKITKVEKAYSIYYFCNSIKQNVKDSSYILLHCV